MINRRLFLAAAAVFCMPFGNSARAMVDDAQVQSFIDDAAARHGLDRAKLQGWFAKLQVNQRVIKLMSAPAGKRIGWRDYRKNMLTAGRIKGGRKFMHDYRAALNRAGKQYGIPPPIITAILGIETKYGGFLGNFGVMESLATLAFAYPPRAEEFRGYLEDLLLYADETGIDPLALRGSFAGAFGMPQFLPGSARKFAVDFDDDGKTDLFTPNDAVGSIGNFLAQHGWRREHGILYKLKSVGNISSALAEGRKAGYRATFSLADLRNDGTTLKDAPRAEDEKYLLVDLPGEGGTEYRAGTENFYALTRYNKSFKYAAAVFDLSAALVDF